MSTTQQEQSEAERVEVLGRDPRWEKNPWAYIRQLEAENARKDLILHSYAEEIDHLRAELERRINRVG